MKRIKKFASLMLAVVMVLAMGITASADNHNISTDSETHIYEIYQIFTGTVEDEKDEKLTSLKYGQNTTSDREVGAAVSQADIATLQGIQDAGDTQAGDQADIAAMAQFVDLSSTPIATVGKDNPKSASVPEGYYLIKDKNESQTGDDQYTLYLMKVLNGDLQISPKTGKVTTSQKKVDDVNDSDGTKQETWDSADYDIGDDVPFHLKATMAENVSAYKKYHLTFTDTLEAGKFDDIGTPVIKIDGKEVSEGNNTLDGYSATVTYDTPASKAGFKVTITFTPTDGTLPVSLNGKDVTIDFTAKLGEGANIGQEGNVNTLELSYSNNPNSADDTDEGKNPEDTVIVFTYKLVVNKVDEAKEPLEGATFSLYKKYATPPTGKTQCKEDGYTDYYLVETIEGTDSSTFEFKGIDDGEYVLIEDVAPAGYNILEPQAFTVVAVHTEETDINKETKKGTSETYVLTSVSSTTVNGAEIELSQNTENNIINGINTTVVNKSGSLLPSTGGIGTTIFYVVGGILVIGAGILLVAKKRMGANK